ncbi:MAG: hypothetical protein LBK26_03280 [Rickettsiales bacterium]|jgi:hypothetical protein|nr:hypothetical protein [Rickettsiales bacterium]
MRKILIFLSAMSISAHCLAAAQNPRATTAQPRAAATVATTARNATERPATAAVSARSAAVATRAAATAAPTNARSAKNNATAPRAATNSAVRTAPHAAREVVGTNIAARAALVPTTSTMGDGYNACRDVYFTCMDQFCAAKDDVYRRCMCSGRLDEIREKERKLKQSAGLLQDFAEYNIDAITKTAQEVAAMLKATPGEYAAATGQKYDKSDATKNLAGISSVLNNAKSQSLSTKGTLDIAGNINAIWSSSDLIGSGDIANLEGRKLYEQVHAQCASISADACPRTPTMNMVVSAYGMYIEQDCNVISAALEGKRIQTAGDVRKTERVMSEARLENYNVHNSAAVNECIAQVRKDITEDPACGPEFVHCLDVTGMYLVYATGEPIYSPSFFNLENQISLTGDTLSNSANRLFVSLLEKNKEFAKRGLDTCRDISADVWDEFMRQALVEIYQGQQNRIRAVKDECISVVNECYDAQTQKLKDFSNMDRQSLLGQTIETAEAMCKTKLDACSNLYGGASGLKELTDFVFNVGSLKVSESCEKYLDQYIRNICTLKSDTLHGFPYDCRIRKPGSYVCEQSGASSDDCSKDSVYAQLAKYARENCVRPSVQPEDPLPSVVQTAVNRIMDTTKREMEKLLRAECKNVSGDWTNDLDKRPKDDSTEILSVSFALDVNADHDWGICLANSCDLANSGERYTDEYGIQQCCANTDSYDPASKTCVEKDVAICISYGDHIIVDTSCSTQGRHGDDHGCVVKDCRCDDGYQLDVPEEPNTPVSCILRQCPSGSDDATDCPAPNGANGELAGCVKKDCKCQSDHIIDITNGVRACKKVECGSASSFDATCTEANGGDEYLLGGCFKQFCRCDTDAYKQNNYNTCRATDCPDHSHAEQACLSSPGTTTNCLTDKNGCKCDDGYSVMLPDGDYGYRMVCQSDV